MPFALRQGLALAGVLRLDVKDGGQVAVAATVVHGQGRALVVGGRVGAVEIGGDDLRVGRQVQAQLDLGGFNGLARGLGRDGQGRQVGQVGLAGRVHRRGHQALPRGVDHVVLVVQGEGAVAGIDVLQAIGRLEREEAVTRDGQVQRVARGGHVALAEFLTHLLEGHTLTDLARGFLQRRGREDVTEIGTRAFEARGAHVGDVVGSDGQLCRGRVQTGQ